MKKSTSLIMMTLLMPSICFCQRTMDVIGQVKTRQHSINSLSYTINRTDTLGNIIRRMSGNAVLEKNNQDAIFGFKFWAKKESDPTEKMFDGHIGYIINAESKTYETTTSPSSFYNLLNGGGGHLVLPDIIKLDTTKASQIIMDENERSFLLTFKYPDIDKYNVTKKFKAVRIDKQLMVPISVRIHQESLGRIQDLYYEISNLKINPALSEFDFSNPGFVKNYRHIIPTKTPSPIFPLLEAKLPYFKLQTFANGDKWISSSSLKNKVVLLDFWEVWCGPCIESMPNIESLLKKYKDKGLLVYGIVNDPANVPSSKILVQKQKISFPMLRGNAQLKRLFRIVGIPLYLVINRSGKVAFISEGYSQDIEKAIVNALKQ